MDFETVVTVVLLLLYLAAQVFGSRKQKPTPGRTTESSPSEEGRSQDVDVRDALREIERALRGEAAEAPPPRQREAEPRPAAPPRTPTSVPEARHIPTRSPVPERRPVPASRAESMPKHVGSSAATALETAAAARAAQRLENTKLPARPPAVKARLPRLAEPAAPERNDLLDRLRRPDTAREAFMLAEVLGPPRSRR